MSNTLYIPELGDELQLSDDWTFDLYQEHRNKTLWEAITGNKFNWRWSDEKMKSVKATLPAGCVLAVDRIYIRKGASDFSSISFRLVLHPEWKKEKNSFGSKSIHRFWAKLKDCNTIKFVKIKDASKEIKINWDYTLADPKSASGYFFMNSPVNGCWEGFGKVGGKNVIKMKITFNIKNETIRRNGLFGGAFEHKVPTNIKYTLFTLDDVLIGTYNTFATAKSNAKKYLETTLKNQS